MHPYLKLFITTVIYVIMDATWIFINKDLYFQTIKDVQGSELLPKHYFAFILTYMVMIIGLIGICLQLVQTNIEKYPSIDKNLIAFLSGGLYGFVVNGIYNMTSYISYKNYSVSISITDTIWAVFLYGIVSILYVNM